MQPKGRFGNEKIVALVITTCTNRKRKPISDALHASSLPQAKLADLAAEWTRRLVVETARYPAGEIYGGRAFQEATAATGLLDARLLIVSAGLGLVEANASVPPYACTVLIGALDSIAGRAIDPMTAAEWWARLNAASPFSVSLAKAVSVTPGLVCAALSEAYIDMIGAELVALPEVDRLRLRIFTRAPLARIAPALRPFMMPYDDRLDGPDSPIKGTRSDFAARALHHFARSIASGEDRRPVNAHAGAVRAAVAQWRYPIRFERVRHDDDALLALIRAHWDAEGGSSSRLLRRFRDDLNIACEQGRFAALARTVRAERT